MNALEGICGGKYVHSDINARDARLKIYVTVLGKQKLNGKEKNSQQRGWSKV